tara:strand:+ start:5545 stop:6372 length:828 start_codon:yes stop_codon:yes gene_type:complete
MKAIYTLIILLIPFIGFTQQVDIFTINNDIFKIHYSSKFQQPLNITYDVPRIHPEKIVDSSANTSEQFKDYITQSDKRTSNNEDYKNNIYDKAHLAPKSHFYSKSEKFKLINDYSNIVLMHKDLNNSIWKKLENEVKKLSKMYDVTVTIEMIFSNQDTTKGGATIPSDFIYSYEYNDLTKSEVVEEVEKVVETVYFYEVDYGSDEEFEESGFASAKLRVSDSTVVTSYPKNLIIKPSIITKSYIIPNTKPTKKKISDYELYIGQLEFKEIKPINK